MRSVSCRLRVILAGEAMVAVAAAAWFTSGTALLGAALAAYLALNCVACIVLYAVLRVYARFSSATSDAVSFRSACSAVGECLALLVQFVLIAPFERIWLGADAPAKLAAGRLPVLLVHGYVCNRGIWWWLRRRLRASGLAVSTLNLEPPFAGIEHFAAQLHRRVEALAVETGGAPVVLVTHSMGGLVARAYLETHGASRVAKLVTLAAAHHGTRVARLGPGRNAREMEPDSALLRRLNASEVLSIPAVSVWSRDDEFIVPHDSSRLAGASEHVVVGLGHVAMTFSSRVLRILQAELSQYADASGQTNDSMKPINPARSGSGRSHPAGHPAG